MTKLLPIRYENKLILVECADILAINLNLFMPSAGAFVGHGDYSEDPWRQRIKQVLSGVLLAMTDTLITVEDRIACTGISPNQSTWTRIPGFVVVPEWCVWEVKDGCLREIDEAGSVTQTIQADSVGSPAEAMTMAYQSMLLTRMQDMLKARKFTISPKELQSFNISVADRLWSAAVRKYITGQQLMELRSIAQHTIKQRDAILGDFARKLEV